MRRLVFAVLVAAFAAACSDQATAPNDQSPAFSAAQGDRSEWTLLVTWGAILESDHYLQGFAPCFNGGAGENLETWGPEAYLYGKEVLTPSGLRKWQGRIVLGGDGINRYRGLTTGDEWVSSTPFTWEGKTNFSQLGGGGFLIQEPVPEIVTNLRTHEQARLLWMWHNHWDGSGNVVGPFRNGEIISCHILTH
jgi:hypothetical protein